MPRKKLGWIVVVVGIVLLLVSALADQIGIGNEDGFGWQQTTGVVVGAVVAVIGAVVARLGGRASDDA